MYDSWLAVVWGILRGTLVFVVILHDTSASVMILHDRNVIFVISDVDGEKTNFAIAFQKKILNEQNN